jgi:hypothetical protein
MAYFPGSEMMMMIIGYHKGNESNAGIKKH